MEAVIADCLAEKKSTSAATWRDRQKDRSRREGGRESAKQPTRRNTKTKPTENQTTKQDRQPRLPSHRSVSERTIEPVSQAAAKMAAVRR